jgi:hypothetical protein
MQHHLEFTIMQNETIKQIIPTKFDQLLLSVSGCHYSPGAYQKQRSSQQASRRNINVTLECNEKKCIPRGNEMVNNAHYCDTKSLTVSIVAVLQ